VFNSTGRALPDISIQATDYVVFNNGKTYPAVAGTSASTPVFSGMVALLNEARRAAGKSPLGFINPLLYSLASGASFTDVTSGSNPGCGTKGFPATQGWDAVTGLGTPVYPKLLEAALALP
jgi:tripeptidyl-peptidase-1